VYSKRGLTDGFRRIDNDHKGSLQAEELRVFFMEEAHCPWFCNERTINVLVDFADLNNDDSIGYLELSNVIECDDIIQFAALVPNKKANSQDKKDREMKIGSRGVTVGAVKDAQLLITERLIARGSGDLRQNNLRSVLAYLDTYENGMITRDEFKAKLKPLNLIKHVTAEKKVKGDLEADVVDTLLDVVDEVARKIEEQMPGDQGGSVESGKVNLAAFAKGCFSQDGLGGFVSIFEVAGII
jgi:Ca2+-binding EF-hand superfamily protein